MQATLGVIDVVEAMHGQIGSVWRGQRSNQTRGITRLVYRTIRGIGDAVGSTIDGALAHTAPISIGSGSGRAAVVAALNGVFGDHLAATGNPLATPMGLTQKGEPLEIERSTLSATISQPREKLLILVHGLCMNDQMWTRRGHDHGTALAAALGYTPLYLRYNSGLHISVNGREFADLLNVLLTEWPVPVKDLAILGHSMGGLVTRSACHYGKVAGHDWLKRVQAMFFLATPHHGAPWERAGNWVDVLLDTNGYTAPLARLGKMRSAGITDLRHGNLLDEDWLGQDRFAAQPRAPRTVVPLPDDIACFAMAGSVQKKPEGGMWLSGDGIVPLSSALGDHRHADRNLNIPSHRRWIGGEMNHFDLLDNPEALDQIKLWLASPRDSRPIRGHIA
jgi:pimeloyl-ACP methyl ester carboxylesterase